jgi:hypothetical protein
MSEYRLGPILSSGKRSFFSRLVFPALLPLLILLMMPLQLLAGEPAAFSDWAKTARIAGSATWIGMEASEINTVLTNMIAQNVTVIEADSDLSMYLTDAEFEQELALMRDFATAAHSRNLRVVWYYPALEVLTANGVNLANQLGWPTKCFLWGCRTGILGRRWYGECLDVTIVTV